MIMHCLFEDVNHFYLSIKGHQDTKIAKYFGVKCYGITKYVYVYQITPCLTWIGIFLQNCFCSKLLIIMFIRMFNDI